MRSFNAVMQSKNEGRNSIFSLKVARLFKDVVQDTRKCAAIVFDDYALFACNTIFGHGILVFDTLTKQFVSFDQLTDDSNANIGPIIDFAKVEHFAPTIPESNRSRRNFVFYLASYNQLRQSRPLNV